MGSAGVPAALGVLANVPYRNWLGHRSAKPYVAWFIGAGFLGALIVGGAMAGVGVVSGTGDGPSELSGIEMGVVGATFLVAGTAAIIWIPGSPVMPARPDRSTPAQGRVRSGKGRPRQPR